MPFTPFHFGLGLFAKSLLPKRVSFLAFAASQVCIDLESGWNLWRGNYPVHGPLHSFLLALPLSWVLGRSFASLARRLGLSEWGEPRGLESELEPENQVPSVLFGAGSHVVLDALMHRDARPFLPWTQNPWLRGVSLESLHQGLVGLGILGLLGLGIRAGWAWRSRSGAKAD